MNPSPATGEEAAERKGAAAAPAPAAPLPQANALLVAGSDRRSLPGVIKIGALQWSTLHIVPTQSAGASLTSWDSFAMQRKIADIASRRRPPKPPLFRGGAFARVSNVKRRFLRVTAKVIALNKVCDETESESEEVAASALQELREVFAVLDAFVLQNGTQSLRRRGLERVLRDLGIELAPTQLDGLVAEDEEGDALVNWRDVYKLVVAFQSFQRVADADLEISEAFEILSGGGLFVDAEILLKCMKHLEAAPEQEREHSKYIATLVKEADVDGDGRVSFQDFVEVMNRMADRK